MICSDRACSLTISALLAALFGAMPAAAEQVADFYRGAAPNVEYDTRKLSWIARLERSRTSAAPEFVMVPSQQRTASCAAPGTSAKQASRQ